MEEVTEKQKSQFKFDLHANTRPVPWMGQQFFEKVIRSYLKDPEARVNNFEIKPGAKPGDNFASVIYKCKLNYSRKNDIEKDLFMVMKTVPVIDADKTAIIEHDSIFKIEMDMYRDVLPEIVELWKSVGDNSWLCPKLIYQEVSPNPVVILEDISPFGFGMIEKPSEDYEVSKMIVQKLAKFHAGSFYLANEKKKDYTSFDICIFKTVDEQVLRAFFEESIEVFIEEVKNWEGFEEYVPKLENLLETYKDKCAEIYKPNSCYNVLNHGDHHPKNLMLQKVDGEYKDVCFLDYQICNYGTPAIDLMYSLYCDLSPKNRQKYRNDYIKYYHDEFFKALKRYGYLKAPPSLVDLHIELLKCGSLETIICICFVIILFDWTSMVLEQSSFDNMGEFKRKCYRDPELQKVIKVELRRFFYNGII